jgi:nucleotide-binding universal stress UspA family protein
MTENRGLPSGGRVTNSNPALEPGAPLDVPDTVPTEWLGQWPTSPGGRVRRGRRRPIRILVAINQLGSVEAQEVAARLALASDASVSVLHIRELGPYTSYVESSGMAHSLAETAVKHLMARGVRSVTGTVYAVESRRVPQAIARQAQQWAAHLLVIGCRRRSVLGSVLFRGTSQRVVRLAPCPVVVVRSPSPARSPQSNDDCWGLSWRSTMEPPRQWY